MPIPKSISPEHVKQAIEQLDRGVDHPFGAAVDYDLVFEGRRYPPKAVLGLAAAFATGAPLSPKDFSGGEGSGQANHVLRNLGFKIERKPESPIFARVWLEMTQSSHDHGGPGWDFGTCLWSPSKNRAGHDWYRTMREPQVGDRVIHCLDSQLVGESVVARECIETNEQPPSAGQYEGLAPYYRVELRDYQRFASPYPLGALMREYADQIITDLRENRPKRYPFFATRGGGLHTVQGAYLTACSPVLTDIIDRVIRGVVVPTTPPPPQRRAVGHRYWVLGLGQDGRLWPECYERGLALIGWDQLGDLRQYPDLASIAVRLQQEDPDGSRPVNNALACFEFAHEMTVGDFILVKRGISDILGLGEVTSDYEFLPERGEYKHGRRVRWTASGHWQLPREQQVPQKTLTEITDNARLLDYILPLIARSPGQSASATLPVYTLADAATDVFVHRQDLLAMFNALSRKKNLILEGPPGVGKTFLARRLAYARIGYKDPTRVGGVQLHQSYAYEDFVQGWRPRASGGFVLKNGVFYEFCQRAREDASKPYVFIIDEINRGNVSKVFGELLMLIEADKRGPEYAVPLTYSSNADEPFYVPENIYVLGLMNTADRSLAMVDYALRRRFAFATLHPEFGTKFTEWLAAKGVDDGLTRLIVARVAALNETIAADTRNLGPGFRIGHSFFCPTGTEERLDRTWYDSIVHEDVEPLLREYWFHDLGRAEALVADLPPVKIPIRNLYYLLCYAWDILRESDVLDVGIEDIDTPQDLLARVLVSGVIHVRRRGLMREYLTAEDRIAGVRGKLQLADTLKQNVLVSAQTHCTFDELDVDALPNQIVKATLRLLGTASELDSNLRTDMAGLYHSLGGISDITLTRAAFGRIQLHRNIGAYRLLLQVCRFVYQQTLPDEAGTHAPFRDFVRDDDQMAALFQRFVFNFFRREQTQYRVDSPQIEWQATAADHSAVGWLPRMQTNIVLRSPQHTIIIDTKYYREAFQSRFGRDKIRSSHLYQILSYALNWSEAELPQGVLLYPTVRQHFDLRYHIRGVSIRVCSVDLNQPWSEIRAALLELASA